MNAAGCFIPTSIVLEIAKFLDAKGMLALCIAGRDVRAAILNNAAFWRHRRLMFNIDSAVIESKWSSFPRTSDRWLSKIGLNTARKIGAVLCLTDNTIPFTQFMNIAMIINTNGGTFVCLNCCVQYMLTGNPIYLQICNSPRSVDRCPRCQVMLCAWEEKIARIENDDDFCLNCSSEEITCKICQKWTRTTRHPDVNKQMLCTSCRIPSRGGTIKQPRFKLPLIQIKPPPSNKK